jgi:2-polyprenyl-3-methyl-5-hydroxy-6-metoxy-1,4-benzoquinol methylase
MSSRGPATPCDRAPEAPETLSGLYRTRFPRPAQARKLEIWRVLCRDFFQRYVRPEDTVVDLGAGFCEFINNIQAGVKYAVDLNPDSKRYAARDVTVLAAESSRLDMLAPGSVDVVFASNFFEHLPDKAAFLATLAEARRILRPGTGRLLVLQPNIRLTGGAYWDFVDHHLPLTERTLSEAAELVGLEPIEIRPRFLPYTTKSRLPQHPLLVRAYLRFPPLQWLLGKQTWFVAIRPE